MNDDLDEITSPAMVGGGFKKDTLPNNPKYSCSLCDYKEDLDDIEKVKGKACPECGTMMVIVGGDNE